MPKKGAGAKEILKKSEGLGFIRNPTLKQFLPYLHLTDIFQKRINKILQENHNIFFSIIGDDKSYKNCIRDNRIDFNKLYQKNINGFVAVLIYDHYNYYIKSTSKNLPYLNLHVFNCFDYFFQYSSSNGLETLEKNQIKKLYDRSGTCRKIIADGKIDEVYWDSQKVRDHINLKVLDIYASFCGYLNFEDFVSKKYDESFNFEEDELVIQLSQKPNRADFGLVHLANNEVKSNRIEFIDQFIHPKNFLGRSEYHKLILEKFSSGNNILILTGEGGIGKSAIATGFWKEHSSNYKHKIFLNCSTGLFKSLITLPIFSGLDYQLNEEEVNDRIKSKFQEMASDILLVLDNVDDRNEIVKFNIEFSHFGINTLITSRNRVVLDPENEIEVQPLGKDEAKQLFKVFYQEENTDFELLLEKFLDAVQNHTLVVEIFAKNLQRASRAGYGMKEFLKDLEKTGLFLKDRSFHILTDYEHRLKREDQQKRFSPTTDEILSLLYDFSMTDKEIYHILLSALSVLPPKVYEFDFLKTLFAAGKYLPDELLNHLDELFSIGFLKGDGNSNFSISPVMQEVVINRDKKKLWENTIEMLNSLLMELKIGYSALHERGTDFHSRYFDLVQFITKRLVNYTSGILEDSCVCAGKYFRIKGDIDLAIYFFQFVENQNVKNTNPTTLSWFLSEAELYREIGLCYDYLSNYQSAKEYHLISKGKYQELLDREKDKERRIKILPGLSHTLSELGRVYQFLGEFELSISENENAIKIIEEIESFINSVPEETYNSENLGSIKLIVYEIKAIALETLGEVYKSFFEVEKDEKNLELAEIHFMESAKLNYYLAQNKSQDIEYLNGLICSLVNVAWVYKNRGDSEGSFNKIYSALEFNDQLKKLSPNSFLFKTNNIKILLELSQYYDRNLAFKDGRNYLEKAIFESEELCKQYQKLPISKVLLAKTNLYSAGHVLKTLGPKETEPYMLKYHELIYELFDEYKGNQKYFLDLVNATHEVAVFYRDMADFNKSLEWYKRLVDVIETYDAKVEKISYYYLGLLFLRIAKVYENVRDHQNEELVLEKAKQAFELQYETLGFDLTTLKNLRDIYWKLGVEFKTGRVKDEYEDKYRLILEKIDYEIKKAKTDNLTINDNESKRKSLNWFREIFKLILKTFGF